MQPLFAHLYAAEARNCSSPTRISGTLVQTVSYKDLSLKDATLSTGDDVLAEHSPRAGSCSLRTRALTSVNGRNQLPPAVQPIWNRPCNFKGIEGRVKHRTRAIGAPVSRRCT